MGAMNSLGFLPSVVLTECFGTMYKVPVRPPEKASELWVANAQSGTYFNFGFSELVGRIVVATGADSVHPS